MCKINICKTECNCFFSRSFILNNAQEIFLKGDAWLCIFMLEEIHLI